MNITIKASSWNELQTMLTAYFTELGYQNDGFHNGRTISSQPYRLEIDDRTIGFFSIGNAWDGGDMLRSFYISPTERRISSDVFCYVLEQFSPKAILVPSNDQHLISLSFETMHRLGTSFDMQAYNFVYGEPTTPAEYDMDCLEEVLPDEYDTMNALTDGQWDGCYGDSDWEFYAIRKDGVTLGYGAFGKMQYNDKNVDVGNFTLPEHRNKGVGRSLIINISKAAIAKGYIPTAGCAYGNTTSIATLKSAGYIPENRLFYVKLVK